MTIPKTLTIELDESGYGRIVTNILRYKTKVKKLHENQPEKTRLIEEEDHKLCLVFPEDWFKFPAPKRNYSKEEREKARERFVETRQRMKTEQHKEDNNE